MGLQAAATHRQILLAIPQQRPLGTVRSIEEIEFDQGDPMPGQYLAPPLVIECTLRAPRHATPSHPAVGKRNRLAARDQGAL